MIVSYREYILRIFLLVFGCIVACASLSHAMAGWDARISSNEIQTLAIVVPMIIAPFAIALAIHDGLQSERLKSEGLDLSARDNLTGLLNRRSFFRQIENMRELSSGSGVFFFMVIDVDHFKSINARFGHEAGDTVLIHVADCLRSRATDDMRIARFGGEEFILAGHLNTIGTLQRFGQRIIQCIENNEEGNKQLQVRVRVSVGSCIATQDVSTELAVAHAEAAMLQVLRTGLHKVVGGDEEQKYAA